MSTDLKTDKPKPTGSINRDQRISEVAKILARGFLRLKQAESGIKAQKTTEQALSSPPKRGSL